MRIRKFNESTKPSLYRRLCNDPNLRVEEMKNVFLNYYDSADVMFYLGEDDISDDSDTFDIREFVDISYDMKSIFFNIEGFEVKANELFSDDISDVTKRLEKEIREKIDKFKIDNFGISVIFMTGNPSEHFTQSLSKTYMAVPKTEEGEDIQNRIENIFPNAVLEYYDDSIGVMLSGSVDTDLSEIIGKIVLDI